MTSQQVPLTTSRCCDGKWVQLQVRASTRGCDGKWMQVGSYKRVQLQVREAMASKSSGKFNRKPEQRQADAISEL